VNRNEPAERLWTALKQSAKSEKAGVSQPEAVKRVKALVRREGLSELPSGALAYYVREYCAMVESKKSG
jgi:cysteine synthase